MARKIIGMLVIFSPIITILICSGFFISWLIPLVIFTGGAMITGITLAGLRILRN